MKGKCSAGNFLLRETQEGQKKKGKHKGTFLIETESQLPRV